MERYKLGQHQPAGSTDWEFLEMVKEETIDDISCEQYECFVSVYKPVKSDSDLSEETLQVLSAQRLLCCIPDFLQGLATCDTGFSIDPSEREVVILWFEVCPLLLRQLE